MPLLKERVGDDLVLETVAPPSQLPLYAVTHAAEATAYISVYIYYVPIYICSYVCIPSTCVYIYIYT